MAVQKLIDWVKNMAKNSPWLMMAVGLHVILGAVMSLVYITHEMQKSRDAATQIAVSAKQEKTQEVIQPPEELDRKKIPDNEVKAELVTYEEETTFVPTEEVEEDLYQDIGDPTGADDGEAFTGGTSIGVGSGGHYGTGAPSAFVSRRAGTATKTKKGRPPKGATVGTEEAVLEGLRWLIRHQNEDGSWGVDTLASRCSPPDKPCIPAGTEVQPYYNTGLTGLALLCFLGQGISVGSKIEIVDTTMGKRHQAGDVVKRGVRWLIDKQGKEQGYLSDPDAPYNMYSEALATMALCEAYGISRNRELKRPAQNAVNWLVAAQKLNQDGARWGWRYWSKKHLDDSLAAGKIDQVSHNELVQDVDISVTGWVVMALKSAMLVGLEVPSDVMPGALAYAHYVTGKEGLVGYKSPYGAGQPISGPGDQFTYHTATMSALGMLVRTFVSHDLEDPFLEEAARHIVKDLPSVSKDKLSIDYYYWYYATLALNQFDGPDSPRRGAGKYWEPWNKELIESILSLQDATKAKNVCAHGGWLENDRWGGHTGYALYSTAINVLTLEVYYRYENAFGVGEKGVGGGAVVEAIQKPK
jgi:hypothetical protein